MGVINATFLCLMGKENGNINILKINKNETMKKLKVFLTLALMMAAQGMMAQTTVIKAVLVDSLTQETEPYATVRVYKGSNMKNAVAMSVSDIDGKINQKVTGKGKYTMTISSMGRKEIQRVITLDGKTTVDLGTIYVVDDTKLLQGVEIVAQKPLVTMDTDKMSYSVEDDVDSKSATVLDMLRKVPMVTVDGQDNITVNGSSSFKVYVNGKPNVMFNSNPSQIFRAMPASMVKNIEVITNPGAKFDAEGSAGVLNIVMAGAGENGQQATINGINGNVRLSAGNKQQNAGLFLSGQYGKFSFSANALVNHGKAKGTDVEIDREQFSDAGTSLMSYKMESTTRMPFSMANLNLGYELDSMSTVSATFGFTRFNMKNNGDPFTTMSGGIYGPGFSYGEHMNSSNKSVSINASADYQRFLNKARTSSITFIYQFALNPTDNENWNSYDPATVPPYINLQDRHSLSKEKSREHVFQTDFTTPLSEKHTLNAGLKFTARDNSSDSRYYRKDGGDYEYDELLSMKYDNMNDILAGYTEYEGKYGKFGAKAGLRYEYTWQDVDFELGHGENFKKHYGNLVPSASLSYKPMPIANIGLTYNMRISRPGIGYLNPYVDRSSTTAISYGNPDLDVEKTHNIGLVFNIYTPVIMGNLNIKQAITNNGIEQYSFWKDGLLNTTYDNIVKRSMTTISLYAAGMLSKKTRLFFNGGIGYNDLRSKQLDTKNHGWQANAMVGLQQTLPWDLKLGAFFITNSKKYTLQGWTSGFNMVMGSLTKSFFNDKLNVAIQGVTGLRKGGRFYFDSYSEGKDFTNMQRIHVPVASFTFNITYNFGNQKVKVKQNTNRVESDVMEKQNDMNQMNNMNMGQ